MTQPDPALSKALRRSLVGLEAHVKTLNAVDDLSAEVAGRKPEGSPHTIFQILNHLVYWHDKARNWMEGGDPVWPEHAEEGWPGPERPASQEEWDGLVAKFTGEVEWFIGQVERDDMFAVRGRWAPVELLRAVASHNSYHIGQIVLLRRMAGAWPPPGGGDTW